MRLLIDTTDIKFRVAGEPKMRPDYKDREQQARTQDGRLIWTVRLDAVDDEHKTKENIFVQFSADAGANLREMMERMGHDSMRAALIYLHTTPARQRAIADQMGRDAKTALRKTKRSGTRMARDRKSK